MFEMMEEPTMDWLTFFAGVAAGFIACGGFVCWIVDRCNGGARW